MRWWSRGLVGLGILLCGGLVGVVLTTLHLLGLLGFVILESYVGITGVLILSLTPILVGGIALLVWARRPDPEEP